MDRRAQIADWGQQPVMLGAGETRPIFEGNRAREARLSDARRPSISSHLSRAARERASERARRDEDEDEKHTRQTRHIHSPPPPAARQRPENHPRARARACACPPSVAASPPSLPPSLPLPLAPRHHYVCVYVCRVRPPASQPASTTRASTTMLDAGCWMLDAGCWMLLLLLLLLLLLPLPVLVLVLVS